MIAMALACKPRLLLADEPTTALDVTVRAQILELLADLQRKHGMAVLLITHDLNLVRRFADRIAVMEGGHVVEQGAVATVFEAPQHAYTRKLMAAVPVADPSRRHKPRALLEGEIPSPIRAVGDEPDVPPLVQVAPGHFVARHAIGGAF